MCAEKKKSVKKIGSSIVNKENTAEVNITEVSKKTRKGKNNVVKKTNKGEISDKSDKEKVLKNKSNVKKTTSSKKKLDFVEKEESVKNIQELSKKKKTKKVVVKNKEKNFFSVGKRKTSIARVFMRKGSGIIFINNKNLDDFFPNKFISSKVLQPLILIKWNNAFDINVNVAGGGVNSQAEAIRLGIAKNLLNFNLDYKLALRDLGFLTRDNRVVERKKFGHKKARRSFQFSKR